MKVRATILLVILVSFTVAPTLLSRFSSDPSIALSFSVTEEENHSSCKSGIINDIDLDNIFKSGSSSSKAKEKICENYLLKHDDAFYELLSPPPEV